MLKPDFLMLQKGCLGHDTNFRSTLCPVDAPMVGRTSWALTRPCWLVAIGCLDKSGLPAGLYDVENSISCI